MNVTRESFVKVFGRWVRVPNWAIVARKPWTTARKNRARDNAARLGAVQVYVMASWIYPVAALVYVVVALGVVGAVESR